MFALISVMHEYGNLYMLKTISKLELLAPAGSIESFHTAIEAGTDAIYLGLHEYNARMRAKNFTIKTLSYLIPFAHNKNVKVYVTLNIQFKQNELESLIHILYQLEQINVDALIVADPGLIQIAHSNFPKLTLHGSTQMAIHNSAGVKMAEKLGLKRVVLARELSIEEISKIKKHSQIDLETFVHGALCYSISGNCLASSILGGASGNRGRCTQVCRREFKSDSNSGFFFSPKDLCAIEYLLSYKANGIASLKIEGRMKGPEYVYAVVKAYRKAIDDNSKQFKAEFVNDMGRPKTTLFLNNNNLNSIIDPLMPPGTGIFLGIVNTISSDSFTIGSLLSLDPGDRLRIQPKNGFEGSALNVLSTSTNGSDTLIYVKITTNISKGDCVYLVSRKSIHSKLDKIPKINSNPIHFRERYNRAALILKNFTPSSVYDKKNELWVKIDTIDWMDYLQSTPCQHLIFAGTHNQMSDLTKDSFLFQRWRSRLYPALPPFISELNVDKWLFLIHTLREKGIKKWVCTNIGQKYLFASDMELIADNPIWIMNYAAQSVILKNGYKWFTYSMEDEYLNIKSIPSGNGILYIYGHVPLFISLIKPAIENDKSISDPYKNTFFTKEKDGLYYFLSGKPLCISQRKEKLSSVGIHNFCIDLSFIKPDRDLLENLVEAYKSGTKVPNGEPFNFKAGLK